MVCFVVWQMTDPVDELRKLSGVNQQPNWSHYDGMNISKTGMEKRQLEKQRQMASAEDCVECGESIPEARRLAVPGVQLCIYCKSKSEQRV